MLRHGAVAFLGCLYVALTVWIVGKQGETYREGLRGDRLAAVGALEPLLPPAESQAVGQATAVPESTAPRPGATTPSSVALEPPPAGRVAEKTQPTPSNAGVGEVKPKPSSDGIRPPEPAAGKGAAAGRSARQQRDLEPASFEAQMGRRQPQYKRRAQTGRRSSRLDS